MNGMKLCSAAGDSHYLWASLKVQCKVKAQSSPGAEF